jgi:PAS domain S-box-containing protein
LAAIQRTARELNSTLDPKRIIDRALECALEITDAEAGLIGLHMDGFPALYQTRGTRVEMAGAHLNLADIDELEQTEVLSTAESSIPSLLPQSGSRLIVPIKRAEQTFGLVVVESSSARIFKEASRHVLSTLVDHAAVALENARLFQDIQRERERVGLIIHSITDGLFTTDSYGCILTFNRAAERLTGWTAGESIGRLCCEVFGCQNGELTSDHDCVLLQAVKGQKYTSEVKFVVRQRTGTKRVISLSNASLPGIGGQPEGTVFLFRDITESEEMDRLQQELIAAISHELRAPLSNISTITEMLMTGSDELEVKPYNKYLDSLKAQTQRLADFSDRILDVYRLETGQMRLQLRPLPVCLQVEELIKSWQVAALHHEITCDLPENFPWIWADENAFQSILNNLIENAIKYSPANTKIKIAVQLNYPGFVAIAVEDEGPGITPEYQTKIFERFYRVDGRDSQLVYGHGLGLYISRNLVEAMKGQIWVESEAGRGSRFTFKLPLMEESHEAKNLSD